MITFFLLFAATVDSAATATGKAQIWAGNQGLVGPVGDLANVGSTTSIFGPQDIIYHPTSGYLYYTESLAGRVRRVAWFQGVVSTSVGWVGGNMNSVEIVDDDPLTARVRMPTGLAFTATSLLVSCMWIHKVKSLTLSTNLFGTYAGTGTGGNVFNVFAPDAQLMSPTYLATLNADDVYIAERDGGVLKRVSGQTKIVTLVSTLVLTDSVTIFKGAAYVTTYGGHAIYIVQLTYGVPGVWIGGVATPGNSLVSGAERFNSVAAIWIDCGRKTLYIPERLGRIIKGHHITTRTTVEIAGTGGSGYAGPGPINARAYVVDEPVCCRPVQTELFVCDYQNNRMHVVGLTPEVIGTSCAYTESETNAGGGAVTEDRTDTVTASLTDTMTRSRSGTDDVSPTTTVSARDLSWSGSPTNEPTEQVDVTTTATMTDTESVTAPDTPSRWSISLSYSTQEMRTGSLTASVTDTVTFSETAFRVTTQTQSLTDTVSLENNRGTETNPETEEVRQTWVTDTFSKEVTIPVTISKIPLRNVTLDVGIPVRFIDASKVQSPHGAPIELTLPSCCRTIWDPSVTNYNPYIAVYALADADLRFVNALNVTTRWLTNQTLILTFQSSGRVRDEMTLSVVVAKNAMFPQPIDSWSFLVATQPPPTTTPAPGAADLVTAEKEKKAADLSADVTGVSDVIALLAALVCVVWAPSAITALRASRGSAMLHAQRCRDPRTPGLLLNPFSLRLGSEPVVQEFAGALFTAIAFLFVVTASQFAISTVQKRTDVVGRLRVPTPKTLAEYLQDIHFPRLATNVALFVAHAVTASSFFLVVRAQNGGLKFFAILALLASALATAMVTRTTLYNFKAMFVPRGVPNTLFTPNNIFAPGGYWVDATRVKIPNRMAYCVKYGALFQSYTPQYHWLLGCELALSFFMTLSYALECETSGGGSVVVVITVGIDMIALCGLRPYHARRVLVAYVASAVLYFISACFGVAGMGVEAAVLAAMASFALLVEAVPVSAAHWCYHKDDPVPTTDGSSEMRDIPREALGAPGPRHTDPHRLLDLDTPLSQWLKGEYIQPERPPPRRGGGFSGIADDGRALTFAPSHQQIQVPGRATPVNWKAQYHLL